MRRKNKKVIDDDDNGHVMEKPSVEETIFKSDVKPRKLRRNQDL